MKTFICLLALAVLPILALAGAGEDFDRGYELATAKGCFECHTLGSRDAGPSFRAIAQRPVDHYALAPAQPVSVGTLQHADELLQP